MALAGEAAGVILGVSWFSFITVLTALVSPVAQGAELGDVGSL